MVFHLGGGSQHFTYLVTKHLDIGQKLKVNQTQLTIILHFCNNDFFFSLHRSWSLGVTYPIMMPMLMVNNLTISVT